MKATIRTLAAAALAVAALLPAGATSKLIVKKGPTTVVFTDAKGDAGNQDSNVPGAVEAGFDLVKGSIGQTAKDLVFTVEHSAMPESGPPGEAFRLIWGVVVDGKAFEMTVKSMDVGKPDVIASAMGQDPNGEERVGKVYGGVARFEECGTISAGINWSQCTTLSYQDAVFDPKQKTVTWAISRKVLKVKKGSTLVGGGTRASTGCQICWVPQYAERSLTPHTIIDSAVQSKTFKVR